MLGVIGRTYFTTAGLSESLHSEVIECKGGGGGSVNGPGTPQHQEDGEQGSVSKLG